MTLFLTVPAFAGEEVVHYAKRQKTTPKEKSTMAKGDIDAILSCFSYGYTAKVVINGRDTGIKGGKSESSRLFNQDHPMSKEAPPEMRDRFFLLKEGENQIQVEFTKQGGQPSDLLLSLELDGYPAPVFLVSSKSKASAKIEKKVILQKEVPPDFKPIYVSDAEEGRSGFIHVSTMGTTVEPILNGQPEMTLVGMSGSIPLGNIKPGKNELEIRYQSNPAQAKELKFAIVTPEWTKFLTRQIKDKSAKAEKFTFTAK
jgi:hypothetical protein